MARDWLEPLKDWLSSVRDDYVERARQAVRPSVEQLRTRYYKLEPRERLMVKVAGLLLGLFLGYNFIWSPIVDFRSNLQTEIATRQNDLAAVRVMVVSSRQFKAELANLERQTVVSGKDLALPTVLAGELSATLTNEKIGGVNALEPKKITTHFTQYSVEVRLVNLSLAQVVDVLFHLKNSKVPLLISELEIRKRPQDPHSFDIDMICSALGRDA